MLSMSYFAWLDATPVANTANADKVINFLFIGLLVLIVFLLFKAESRVDNFCPVAFVRLKVEQGDD